MYYMKPLKSPTHIHFLTKNFYRFETVFRIMIFGILLVFLYAYYAERRFCRKYTRALSPVWNRPPYTRIICEENFAPDIYEKLRCVRNPCAIDWVLISLRSFVSRFVYAVIVWIRTFLLIGWCQILVIKAWLNCINSL